MVMVGDGDDDGGLVMGVRSERLMVATYMSRERAHPCTYPQKEITRFFLIFLEQQPQQH
jgi:hypothetical protein